MFRCNAMAVRHIENRLLNAARSAPFGKLEMTLNMNSCKDGSG